MNYESGEYKNIHYGDILIKLPTLVDCDKILLPFVNDNILVSPKLNLLKTGDIVIADTAEDYTAGKAIEIKNKSSKVISGLHTISCRPNFEFYNGYLGYYLNSFTFRKNLFPLIQGIKVYSISKYMYNFLFINYPSLLEQKKITDLLLNIDARIQTQNKIIEALASLIKQLKADSFSKMEINGNSYYFEELFIKYSKNNIMNYPQYTVGKYGIKSMEQSNLYSTNNHIVFEPNSLILGIGIEECGVSKDLYGCCSPIYKIYKINNKIIKPDFVDLFIRLFLKKKKNFISQKSTRREYEIVYSLLDKTLFCIPSINEQEKITFHIKKLIEKLNLEKEILNKYVEEKNYLLANLFI